MLRNTSSKKEYFLSVLPKLPPPFPLPEAQKPKTFRIATFYAQKLSDEVRETVSHDRPKKSAFASHDIAKEYAMKVLGPPTPQPPAP